MAESYKSKVATAKNVEFVHISCDNDEAAMKGFMKDMGFTFPAVTRAKAAKIDRLEELSPSGIPNYKLLDATGKVIAEGSEAKHKAEELAAGGGSTEEKKP